MQTDLFGNPLPPAPQETAAPQPTCGECRYCKQEHTRHICRCPSSWGGIGAAFPVNPAALSCVDFKPKTARA